MSPPSPPSDDRPVGRRPGDPADTREAILVAARTIFGEVGFDRATIRAIAERAEVDPALVIHYFGKKTALFAAAHALPFDPQVIADHLRVVPAAERGEALARLYLDIFAGPDSAALSLLRAAATNDDAAHMLREVITEVLISQADWLAPGPDGERRLALAGAQLIGMVFGRRLLELGPLRDAAPDDLVALVGPVVQGYLDGV